MRSNEIKINYYNAITNKNEINEHNSLEQMIKFYNSITTFNHNEIQRLIPRYFRIDLGSSKLSKKMLTKTFFYLIYFGYFDYHYLINSILQHNIDNSLVINVCKLEIVSAICLYNMIINKNNKKFNLFIIELSKIIPETNSISYFSYIFKFLFTFFLLHLIAYFLLAFDTLESEAFEHLLSY